MTENTDGEILIVGEYEITKMNDGSYWIRHESGEGMQVHKEVFEKLIEKFYLDYF